jgi:hypothetical protein
MKDQIIVIDPPSGWKYGFPKILPNYIKGSDLLSNWLLDNGYPQEDIELALKHSRYWSIKSNEK